MIPLSVFYILQIICYLLLRNCNIIYFMRVKSKILIIVIFCILFSSNNLDVLLQKGKSVISEQKIKQVRASGNDTESNIVNISHPGFDKAFHIKVNKQQTNVWDSAISWVVDHPMKKDDIVVAVFHVKYISEKVEANGFETALKFYYESNGLPYTKSYYGDVIAGDEWGKFIIPIKIIKQENLCLVFI